MYCENYRIIICDDWTFMLDTLKFFKICRCILRKKI